MAGEWSKKIGEDGERIVAKLMDIIGWRDVQTGLDIPCVHNKEHDRKKAHGLDGLFSYNSPLHDRVLKHVCISVKYHGDKYPSSSKSDFKDHVKKLDATMECFGSSEVRSTANKLWSSGINTSETVGVLVWLHGDRSSDSDDDLIDKFRDLRMPTEVELKHPIMLIDQKRAELIFETHEYAKLKYPNHEVTFNYHQTGHNNVDEQLLSDGDKLPWELLSSGIIIYRATTTQPDERVLIFSSIDKFSEDSFKRLLSLAQNISRNLANKIEICYPDFVGIKHDNTVGAIKASFNDSSFTRRVAVTSYKPDVRN